MSCLQQKLLLKRESDFVINCTLPRNAYKVTSELERICKVWAYKDVFQKPHAPFDLTPKIMKTNKR